MHESRKFGRQRFPLRCPRRPPLKIYRPLKDLVIYIVVFTLVKQLIQSIRSFDETLEHHGLKNSRINKSNSSITNPNSVAELYRIFRNSSGVLKLSNKDLEQARRLYWKSTKNFATPLCNQKQQHAKYGNFSYLEGKARQEISRFESNTFLKKTVFESKPKVILFVGLEGTGHHFVRKSFKVFYGAKANFSSNRFLTYSSLMKCGSHKQVFDNHTNLAKLKKDLVKFKYRVLFLNSIEGAYFLSYPNCGGGNRAVAMPDARHLAELCENLGLDFQVILLSRNPESVLISTVVHRRFGPNFGFQSKLYSYVLRIIESQLQMLDQRFITACINIEFNSTQFDSGLLGLQKRVGANETVISMIRQDRSPRHFKCLLSKDEKLKDDFTEDIVTFYKEAIVFQRLCEHVPKIWSSIHLTK